MDQTRALVSSWASITDGFRTDHLKLCFLWYDEVVIETTGDYQRNHFAEQLLQKESLTKKEQRVFTDIILPLEQRVSKEVLDKFQESQEPGYPRWGKNSENYTYPNPENAEQHAHNILLAHIQRDWGIEKSDGYNLELVEGRTRASVESVRLWDTINLEMPCMLQATNYEKLAMVAARVFNHEESAKADPFRLFEMSVPSLATVSWSDIVRIKEKGDFDKLREKLKDVVSHSNGDYKKAQSELSKHEENAVVEIIEKYRPNVKKVAIESAISNIPFIPILNPVCAFFGARDVRNEYRKAEELNWFYLLRDIKNLSIGG